MLLIAVGWCLLAAAGFLIEGSQQQQYHFTNDRLQSFFASKFPRGLRFFEEPHKCQLTWLSARAELRDNARGENEIVFLLDGLGAKMYHDKHTSLLRQFNEDCVAQIGDNLNRMMNRKQESSVLDMLGPQPAAAEAEVIKLRSQVLSLQYKLDFAVVKLRMLLERLQSWSFDETRASSRRKREQPPTTTTTTEKPREPLASSGDPRELGECLYKLDGREAEIDKLKQVIRELNAHMREKEQFHYKTLEYMKNSLNAKQADLDRCKAQASFDKVFSKEVTKRPEWFEVQVMGKPASASRYVSRW